ncbi:hypothetical protein [Streptomyces carpaticus]|uniref:Uncharacterized protein n=1 Tax=Streptomyces carpaticus TaxID=285558 RepID=A0ABV4ZQC6_9ACTN
MSTAPDLLVTLASRMTPSLPAGAYTLSATQPLTRGNGTRETVLSARREVAVTAPRFALSAPDVVAVHPPPGADGDFRTTLPHLCSASAALPWARSPDGWPAGSPWLALLTVRDDDVVSDDTSGTVCSARTVGSLAGTAPSGVLLPKWPKDQAPEKTDTAACRTVDIRLDALARVLPPRADHRWLAHVREVTVKASTRQAGWEPGCHSVVLGTRMPRTAGRYTALLVSLEGFTTYTFLGGSDSVPGDVTRVRMVALWSWSFTHTPAPGDVPTASFSALAARLTGSVTTLRLTHPPGDGDAGVRQYVTDRLERGYVPVAHQLPTGEHLPAWYRGPFTAKPAVALPRTPSDTADESLILLQDHGLYDVSYACAHSLGRVLALANSRLLSALGAYRSAGLSVLHRVARANGHAAGVGEGGGPRDRFDSLVTNGLAASITKGLAHKRGSATPLASAPDTAPAGDLAALVARLTDPAPGAEGREAGGGEEEPDAVRTTREALASVAEEHVLSIAAASPDPARLLASLPLDHLVPHEAMLPQHSARFFWVDAQWLDALEAGVLSAGAVTALDTYLAGTLRRRGYDLLPPTPAAGCLLRSPLVREWPDLLVEATSVDTSKVMTVHTSRPLPDVLLTLFSTLPNTVTFREPPHGLSMGIDSTADRGTLRLRAPVSMTGKSPGQALDTPAVGIDAHLRAGTELLDPASLATKVRACWTVNGVPEDHKPTPASLALQLVQGAGKFTFTAPVGQPSSRQEARP